MSHPQSGEGVRASLLERVHDVEADFRIAFFETQTVINEYYSMSRSDGDFKLDKALKRQQRAMDKYVVLCRDFFASVF